MHIYMETGLKSVMFFYPISIGIIELTWFFTRNSFKKLSNMLFNPLSAQLHSEKSVVRLFKF